MKVATSLRACSLSCVVRWVGRHGHVYDGGGDGIVALILIVCDGHVGAHQGLDFLVAEAPRWLVTSSWAMFDALDGLRTPYPVTC